MQVSVVGTGYVGLVIGACLAKAGHSVLCLDIDQTRIDLLQKGIVPFYEENLERLVCEGQDKGLLTFSSNYEEAVSHSDLCFLALPTPLLTDGSCSMEALRLAIERLAILIINKPFTFVIKSTILPGFSATIQTRLEEISQSSEATFTLVANPEFLREGSAVQDFLYPDRIILGSINGAPIPKLTALYSSFGISEEKMLWMTFPSAEMTKYAANTMLASRISFINEIALLSEKAGADINSVCAGIGADARIGTHYLKPGIGFGGSCLPKDLALLRRFAKKISCPTPLLDSVELVNNSQKKHFLKKIETHFQSSGGLQGKKLAILGLAFKADTDDIRNSPACDLVEALLKTGALLQVFDPKAMQKAFLFFQSESITWVENEYSAADAADALLILTDWPQFKELDFIKIHSLMRDYAFFDGRNQFKAEILTKLGFEYFSIGTPEQKTTLSLL